jgi:hypothetical protein
MENQTMQTKIDQYADIIDVRDIIARFEDVESQLEGLSSIEEAITQGLQDEWEEMGVLGTLLEDLAGGGGDEQWRGDWYPVTLIRESYFVDYVQELLEDCGTIPKDLPHYVHIDWESTARDIRTDYSGAEFHGVTYWYR